MKPLSFIVLFLVLTASKTFSVESELRVKHFSDCNTVCKAISPSYSCCFGVFCGNLAGDPFNCGKCGKRCDLGKICCSGKCVNVMRDRRNCGKCGKPCKPDESCFAGLCGYA